MAALRAGAACAVAAVIAATTGATAPGAFAVGVAVPLAIEQVVRVNQALGRR